MMKMLRIIAVLLAASLLCACGSETALSPSPSPSVSAEPSPSPTPSSSAESSPSPTPSPSPSASVEPSPTPSPSPSTGVEPSPTPSASAEPSPSPSAVTEDTSEKTIDVVLSGGTGRSSVETPSAYFTKDGTDYARIVWSSANYIYMIVDGVQYDPVNDGGNSAFEIPIQLDTDMAVTACTVAMSAPTEIEYTLRFDSGSIK